MTRPALLRCSALLLALAPAAAHPCSKVPFPTAQFPRGAHLIATARADTALAGPGDVRYVVSPGHFGPTGERAIHGQVVDVERIGGMAARALDPGVSQVVLVPWDYGADCTPTPWGGSARWVDPGTRGLYVATLRDRGHWANGLPTFDVHDPAANPYSSHTHPPKPRFMADSMLSVEDYHAVLELLPSVDDAERSAAEAYEALLRWAERRPDLASRYPAANMISYARYDIAYARLRSIDPALAGTYRMEARLDGEMLPVFYVRTRERPTTSWSLAPPGPDGEETEDMDAAAGYYLLSSGSLSPDSLPVDCGPGRQMEREGYIAVLKESEPGTTPRTWRGKIEVGLVASQFPDEPRLRTFGEDEFTRFRERYERGEPDDAPARFVLTPEGSVLVEQTIRLEDGRTLQLSGTRISTETIADPE